MKKLILFLIVALASATIKAQDNATVKPTDEYAFIYVDVVSDSLKIYFDNGKIINIAPFSHSEYQKNFTEMTSITDGFGKFIKGFKYLEAKGYELASSSHYLYVNYSIPYYLFRKKRPE